LLLVALIIVHLFESFPQYMPSGCTSQAKCAHHGPHQACYDAGMSFTSDAHRVSRALEAFRRASVRRSRPVVRPQRLADLVASLDLAALARDGGLTGRRLSRFLDVYLDGATRLHHPAYMAHQVAVPHPSGALAALVDGFTNNAMAIYEMGPTAAAIEFFVLNWMIARVGWTAMPWPHEQPAAGNVAPAAGGVLTHGGSLANLTALLAARNRCAPDAWEKGVPSDLVLLAPAESHYSVSRAAAILGLGNGAIRHLEVDGVGRILPGRIPAMLARVRAEGKRPMALVANACSTALGLYDPLADVAAACAEAGVWMHVDGAHGAGALVSDRLRGLLRGIEGADSLVWDAHKLMQTPTLCTAVLVRDAWTLDTAFEQEASYLFHDKAQPGVDFIHRAVECTKAGLGLRFFTVLAALGEKGLAAYVERQFDLGAQAWEYVSGQPDFECPVRPDANILCFRLRAVDDAAHLAIRDELIADGSFHLSTAEHAGRRHLRVSLMGPDTTMEDIRGMIERVRRAGERPTARA
jgi:L-2,4-diaminobutyrate decarboxylase